MKAKFILWGCCALIVGASLFFAGKITSEKKTGYVDLPKLISEFKGTQEREHALKDIENTWTHKLNTARLDMETAYGKLTGQGQSAHGGEAVRDSFLVKRNLFETLNQEAQEIYSERQQKLDEQILAQISSYLKDFGKAKGFAYLHGANGSGNILFAADNEDVTADAIQFVNNRYEGR